MKKNNYLFLLLILIASFYCFCEENRNVTVNGISLHGQVLKFSDEYGPYTYKSEIIHYESEDKAQIEATLLTPNTNALKTGIVFVHMWARDRMTYWGLPEYLATFGYVSIYMDLRGHGNSKFPDPYSKKVISIDDKKKEYQDLYLDILPAIDILNNQAIVKKGNLILIGASLGCPLGANAVEKKSSLISGMIFLSPAIDYFDVNCKKAIKNLKNKPTYVVLESTDKSFSSGMSFFNNFGYYKTLLKLDRIGHGSDTLYLNIGFPTIIKSWIEQIEALGPFLNNIKTKIYLNKK